MTIRQLLALAWRESRFARSRLFLFLSSISLGVAALVAVQGFGANMQREVRDQARSILGADVSLASRQPFGERTEETLDSLGSVGVPVARVTSFASMALHEPSGTTRLVQVRASDPGFPFYGEIETEPAGEWSELSEGRNLIADPALLVALSAEVGDSIALGATRFRISAVLRKLPGDVEIASSFAPRVFIPSSSLAATELMGFGARVEYEAYLRIPDAERADLFVEGHREIFRPERVRARTLEDQQERMEEALGRLSDFLGLIGVFALLLGGIGVASAMSAYMARKGDTIAVLRCLGATARQLLWVYMIQALVMGLAGAAVGVLTGAGVQWVLPRLFEGLLPVDVQIRPDAFAALTGLVVGVWTAGIFTLLPILRIRSVSPLSALRRGVEPLRPRGRDLPRAAAWAALFLSALLLVMLQAGSVQVGLSVSAGIALTLGLLWVAARAVTDLMRRIPREALPYTARQGLANLHRPGNQTATVLLALGFGVFLIGTLILVQSTILRPLRLDSGSSGNLLLFDVQQDQLSPVSVMLRAREIEVTQSTAIVPMRITAIDGVEVLPLPADEAAAAEMEDEAGVDGDNDSGEPEGWAIRREYRSTYRDTTNATETIVAGRWWEADGGAADSIFEVSLDQDVATELGVEMGARIDWDVQGIRIPTVVTSLRAIDWARLEPNFFAVFETAALENAPQTWVLLARSDSASSRDAVQRDIVSSYPNVSAIDLTLIQRALDDVVGRVSVVIRFLAAFSVVTGFLVLLGAVATGRPQRVRESILLKTLGATRAQIGRILLMEYALLGALSALVGGLLALAAGWTLARWLFEVGLAVEPLPLLGLMAGITALSAAIGLSASREVFRSTPMEGIREG